MYIKIFVHAGFTDDNHHVDNLHYTNDDGHVTVRSSRQIRQQNKNYKRFTLVSSTVSWPVGYTHRNVIGSARYAGRSTSLHGGVY